MMGKKDKRHEEEKILDVDAAMQGSLIFKDPVNLRINGRFEGLLNTKGNLMIGEAAAVNADITGDSIII
ncbi:MAG: polymer-forming cytoskeletal protein, partial [Candidatus Omnitrophota bacterium]